MEKEYGALIICSREYDEAGFCRVLASALDSGRYSMDFFYAVTKLANTDSFSG